MNQELYFIRGPHEMIQFSIRDNVLSVRMWNGLNEQTFESVCANHMAALQEQDKCIIETMMKGFRRAST